MTENIHYDNTSTAIDKFSLHDSRAVFASFENEKLIFCFEDGIYYADYSDDWPNTGKAEVEFTIDLARGITVYQFVESDKQTIRKEIDLKLLIDRINSREWELEFLYRYDGYKEILYKCWIWENESPMTFECELWISTKEDTVFRWNDPVE